MRLSILIFCSLFTAVVPGQEPKESVPPTTPDPQTDPTRIVYELEVSSAGEPRPAMKYRLLPNPADLKPGNAATQYYKAFVLEAESPIRTKEYIQLAEWMETPLRELNIEELGKTLRANHEDAFYRCLRAATYRAHCDWEEPVKEEGVQLLLPALQSFRSVARLLSMKAKYEIATGNYDEAILTALDNFTLAYHLQHDGEILVQSLVGVAIVGMMHDEFFVEWIRSPGSPNLYWALSEFPVFIDSRKIIAGDLRFPEYTLPLLRQIDRRPLTAEEAANLAERAFAVEPGSRLDRSDAKRRAQLTAWAVQTYDEGYRELVAAGHSRELLDQMPVLQVALLARWKRYENARDDLYKWTAVVYGPAREVALTNLREIYRRTESSSAPFWTFMPPLSAMYQAQLRQHRFLSVLRAIEALRLHAARYGEFPTALAEIREVPVLDDPVTKAPFVYSGGGKTATLKMVRHELGADLEYEYRLRLREAKDAK
ncbi:MAG: hypothetical protein WD894_00355 [Pirellulales bacterium]